MSGLGWGGHYVFGSLVVSRIALKKSMMVACSRLLIVTRSRDLFSTCFRVLHTT